MKKQHTQSQPIFLTFIMYSQTSKRGRKLVFTSFVSSGHAEHFDICMEALGQKLGS